ncbi:uncharacterized protein T551_01081 [Pneumocystis jirovecii RU7]|uniref:Uncharacterized protein n=1 Tax=Pneumocystis jirovecii (strain RU7) TaxID=1408657 RepID=A0A0W4ZTW9_PNEJ7|nr:uncharacterized protein T551_01081 [Pneumocystis jirovecii RU7]KTW31820.1 hypothetical protein T551_01081 [Pneumocystis jirovecii RU7]
MVCIRVYEKIPTLLLSFIFNALYIFIFYCFFNLEILPSPKKLVVYTFERNQFNRIHLRVFSLFFFGKKNLLIAEII